MNEFLDKMRWYDYAGVIFVMWLFFSLIANPIFKDHFQASYLLTLIVGIMTCSMQFWHIKDIEKMESEAM